MRTAAIIVVGLALDACGGSSSDLTDLAGNTGKRESVSKAFGDLLQGTTAEEKERHAIGRTEFVRARVPATGLGPVMTGAACLFCHDAPPAEGGSNQRLETRFGRRNADGTFDPLLPLGGPLLQDQTIGLVSGVTWVAEKLPPEANVVAQRRTTPLFGLGLVDATPDATFLTIAAWQSVHDAAAAGRPSMVPEVGASALRVGKFGWKAAQPTLLQFNADAFVNEMGITTPIFPDENCPQGNCGVLAQNPSPGVNDPDGSALGQADDFVRFLGPPPRGPSSGSGAATFAAIGCGFCHVQTLVTSPNASAALDRVAYHPFSDFLLHDMGSLGDGIDQGDARAAEMRTQPLWGVSKQTRLLHDGRVRTVGDAILAHDGQGKPARDRFEALSDSERRALLAFLDTL
jgi:di-heme oxidoreductase (putative peroxidase)